MSLVQIDKGSVKENNEQSAENRCQVFKTYCEKLGFQDLSFSETSSYDRELILTTFAMEIADGTILKKKVGAVTVKNYVRSASEFATSINNPDPRYNYDYLGNRLGGQTDYISGLSELYSSLEKWKKKKAEGMPLPIDIVTSLIKKSLSTPEHSEIACIRDSTCLGLFTGSRCSEYCRGICKPPAKFSTVPVNPQTEDSFAGWPIAFTVNDFTFFSHSLHIVPWFKVDPSQCTVKIRFRYDKGGGRNFSERSFAPVTSADPILQFLCPVRTCLRIIQRWFSINGDPLTPVFCFQHSKSKQSLSFLDDKRINKIYRSLIKELYPEESHLFRTRLQDFRTHSVRITACLLLTSAGHPEHVTSFKLRWVSDAWRSYLREHLDDIRSQTSSVFLKAIKTGSSTEHSHSSSSESTFDNTRDDGN